MSLISKPVDWEVFNIPSIQPVQYYSVLRKQREFSQLIKQYDAQVFRHGYLHYCGIVPKYSSPSFNNRCEIFIVFLDETPTTSFIGFRLKVNKETFTYESKSLLQFLKNSEKAVFYSMNNNRIHVHCGTNAWELFYLLYDEYLRRYVLTVIGTQFFYHFVYSYCIEKEKKLFNWISKGSKLIRVSKSSIYYKIHRKRKISVTDLIHMTLNMPKRKKYTLSSFNFKDSLLHSDVEYSDFYTVAGNKIDISKLTLKKLKKQDIVPEKCCPKLILTHVTHKRKFDKIDANQNLEPNTSSKYLKTSESHSAENMWQHYQKLKSFTVPNYTSISFINTLVPSLLKREDSSSNSNLNSVKVLPNINLPTSLSYNKEDAIKNSTDIQKASRVSEKNDTYENSENFLKKTSLYESKSVTYLGCIAPKNFSSHYSTLTTNNHESLSCTNNSKLIKSCDINSIHFSTNIKNDVLATDDVKFTTAAGKMINISSTAMLKAYKLCEKEQTLPEKNSSDIKQNVPEKSIDDTVRHEVPEKTNYSYSKGKSVTKDITLPKISENKYSFIRNDKNMPKKRTAAHLSNTESPKRDNFDVTEDVSFSTASGKTINISNVAMKAAQKLIGNANDEVKLSLQNKNVPVQKSQFFKDEISNNDSASKADDVDMDNTLVEKFFEDVQFDEKEFELTESNNEKDNLKVTFESKRDKSLPTHKPRKSLGGRRSMKYCSDKL